MADDADLIALHKKSMHNRTDLLEARICGCFYCLKQFEADRITRWTDDDDTALCPFCTIDSVLGFQTQTADAKLLSRMHEYWFKRTVTL
jgi:hypothetical protein